MIVQTPPWVPLALALIACGRTSPPAEPSMGQRSADEQPADDAGERAEADAEPAKAPRTMPTIPDPPQLARVAQGGRLFDKWWADVPDFVPAQKGRRGRGGPFDDGTLPDSTGERVLNDAGHDYRLVRFFGWDLQGARGVDGPGRRNIPTVRTESLLDPKHHPEGLRALIFDGAPGFPAFGSVIDDEGIDSIVAFIMAVRQGPLPDPRKVYANVPVASAPYILRPGGDPERGHRTIANRCAQCHGEDGTALLLDDGALSLGTFGRTEAFEGWLKVAVGHPGSVMKSQLPGELDGPGHTTYVLDVFAALCDRSRYPRGPATDPDVPDDDPRCDRYLR